MPPGAFLSGCPAWRRGIVYSEECETSWRNYLYLQELHHPVFYWRITLHFSLLLPWTSYSIWVELSHRKQAIPYGALFWHSGHNLERKQKNRRIRGWSIFLLSFQTAARLERGKSSSCGRERSLGRLRVLQIMWTTPWYRKQPANRLPARSEKKFGERVGASWLRALPPHQTALGSSRSL